MPLINIPKNARAGKEPCGECHLPEGETCDICGARHGASREAFVHVTPSCDHDFKGWREFADGNGGEAVCDKCGMGAMSWSLRTGL